MNPKDLSCITNAKRMKLQNFVEKRITILNGIERKSLIEKEGYFLGIT